MAIAHNLSGQRFGRLVALRRADRQSGRRVEWECSCDCGRLAVVCANNLKAGRQVSCGCYREQQIGERSLTHGQTGTVEYKTWLGIKKRCYNTACKSYADYGGRGITVCERWLNDFPAFLADMGPRPASHSIERIDNHGPYSPDNCRWASRTSQNRNTRRNHYIEHNGQRLTLQELADSHSIDRLVVLKRLNRGWSVERALTEPPRR
jgi:hypothetical protein